MANDNSGYQQTQPGTGSAENQGTDRSEQVNQQSDNTRINKQDIAAQIGEDESRISSIEETGSLSGRDDAAGGTGDGMESQSTGQETDR